ASRSTCAAPSATAARALRSASFCCRRSSTAAGLPRSMPSTRWWPRCPRSSAPSRGAGKRSGPLLDPDVCLADDDRPAHDFALDTLGELLRPVGHRIEAESLELLLHV